MTFTSHGTINKKNSKYPQRQKRREIRIPTPASLDFAAVRYLSRFAASEASLRRVLENRLRRAAMAHPDFASDPEAQNLLRQAIDAIVERHTRSGAINDAAFAETKAVAMRRAGRSARRITDSLRDKGIDGELITAAIHSADGDDWDGDSDFTNEQESGDLTAAHAFARRRRLGPWRKTVLTAPLDDEREQQASDYARRRKDYAALARAGFSRTVIIETLGSIIDDE